MPNVAVSEWLPEIEPRFSGVPVRNVEAAIRKAIDTFLRETRIWTGSIPAISSVANTASYALATGDPIARVAIPQMVLYDNVEIPVRGVKQIRALYGEGWETETGTPGDCFQDTPGTLRLVPIPTTTVANGIKVYAVFTIVRNANEVPSWLADDVQVFEAIAAGARAELAGQVGSPWMNPAMYPVEERKFEDACASIRLRALFGGGDQVPVIQQPAFGGINEVSDPGPGFDVD